MFMILALTHRLDLSKDRILYFNNLYDLFEMYGIEGWIDNNNMIDLFDQLNLKDEYKHNNLIKENGPHGEFIYAIEIDEYRSNTKSH